MSVTCLGPLFLCISSFHSKVFHGAVAIAAAVPQLMVNAGNSMSTSNLPTATMASQSASGNMDKLSSTASQENLINVESVNTYYNTR